MWDNSEKTGVGRRARPPHSRLLLCAWLGGSLGSEIQLLHGNTLLSRGLGAGWLYHRCHVEIHASQQEAREAQGEDSLRFRPAFLHSAPGSCAGSLQTTMGLLSPPLLAFCQKSRRDSGNGGWNKLLLVFEALPLPVRLPNKASPPCQPCDLH